MCNKVRSGLINTNQRENERKQRMKVRVRARMSGWGLTIIKERKVLYRKDVHQLSGALQLSKKGASREEGYGGTSMWGMREHRLNVKRAIEVESKWEIIERLVEGHRGVKKGCSYWSIFSRTNEIIGTMNETGTSMKGSVRGSQRRD